MCHHHHHHQMKNKKILFIAFLLTFSFALLEIATGFFIQSLALLGEGIHMGSDGINLLMSFIAITIGMKAATMKMNFGFRRIETITAFLNGLALMAIPVFLVYEAFQRFTSPQEIAGMNMLIVASIGLLINMLVAYMLHKADQSSLNVRAAAFHVLSDLLSSAATIVAALFIMYLGWHVVDPIVSTIVSVTIFIGGWKITKESFLTLMEGVPHDMDAVILEQEFKLVPGVQSISTLKIWSITSEVNYLNLHVVKEEGFDPHHLLKELKEVANRHQLNETIQIE